MSHYRTDNNWNQFHYQNFTIIESFDNSTTYILAFACLHHLTKVIRGICHNYSLPYIARIGQVLNKDCQ